jgi:hypothetical protein
MRNSNWFRCSESFIVLLVTVVFVLKTPELYRLWNLNQANQYLLRWSILGDDDCQEGFLTRATQLGDRAGINWTNSYGERVRALHKTLCRREPKDYRDSGEYSYQTGLEHEAAGDIQKAINLYQDACDKDERHVLACFTAYTRITAPPQPGKDTSLSRLQKLIPVQSIVPLEAGGITLIGFDLQVNVLQHDDSLIPITLYWEIPEPTGLTNYWEEQGWSYVQVGTRLYQIGQVKNLLPNGGFERDLSNIAKLPFGYENIRYSVNQDPNLIKAYHRMELVDRENDISQVAVIVNQEEKLNGLTTINGVDISAGDLYLMSGLMRVSDTGVGSLGGVWRTNSKEDIRYWYIARNLSGQVWTQVSGVFRAPQDAEVFTILALNKGEGEVYFDDLVFSQIPTPEIAHE